MHDEDYCIGDNMPHVHVDVCMWREQHRVIIQCTLDVCASSTSLTICANIASEPTCVASNKSTPFWFIEPPITVSPGSLGTGMASPTEGGIEGGMSEN